MNEAGITPYVKRYVEKTGSANTECYEIKLVNLEKSKSFAFNRVAEHQIKGLLDSLEGFWYKIVDSAAINGFSAKKPFDSIWIKAKASYVVVVFYSPRKFKKALFVPIKRFVEIEKHWEKKSIKMEELEKQEGVMSVLV